MRNSEFGLRNEEHAGSAYLAPGMPGVLRTINFIDPSTARIYT